MPDIPCLQLLLFPNALRDVIGSQAALAIRACVCGLATTVLQSICRLQSADPASRALVHRPCVFSIRRGRAELQGGTAFGRARPSLIDFRAARPDFRFSQERTKSCRMAHCARSRRDFLLVFEGTLRISGLLFRIATRLIVTDFRVSVRGSSRQELPGAPRIGSVFRVPVGAFSRWAVFPSAPMLCRERPTLVGARAQIKRLPGVAPT